MNGSLKKCEVAHTEDLFVVHNLDARMRCRVGEIRTRYASKFRLFSSSHATGGESRACGECLMYLFAVVHSGKFYRANFASLDASSFSGFTSRIGWRIAVDNLAIVPLASDFGTLVLARRAPYNPFKIREFLRSSHTRPSLARATRGESYR
jgi:hypothetical protein